MADSGQRAAKPITLIPVGLKEAALDSPTFRSSFTHFAEQLELVEKWLEAYVRCIYKMTSEVGHFEALVDTFLAQTVPPTHVSEAVLDHDYTLLAMKRYGEGAKDFWTATIKGLKRIEVNMAQPIKAFLENDLRSFRNARRNFDQTQRQLDHLQSRYAAQAKTKEASSLREDAFQLHEARKAYLKASLDFGVMAPQLRMRLDKMLVKVFADQWRDMRDPIFNISPSIDKWESDIDRVKGWSREIESSEKVFLKELHNSRGHIEESAELAVRPSRELEDYAVDSATASRSRGPPIANLQTPGSKPRSVRAYKQGWLNLRSVSGKPSRTIWLRRWFYVKNGIFGWLVQGTRSGGVEESERIGVLLCNVKPGNSDDRRYVFEVKTKDTTVIVQAETQTEVNDWLAAFDVGKQKALDDPASTESSGLGPRAQDPAFAILPPSAPEFAASTADSGMHISNEDSVYGLGMDRTSTRNSFDIGASRRSVAHEKDSDSGRDPASRLIQKLDLHRRPIGGAGIPSPSSPGLSGGGIASLIAASHGSMPVGPGVLPTQPSETPTAGRSITPLGLMRDLPTSTLAPNTLANPPAPTNLSVAAVIVNGERGVGIGRADAFPSGLMANVWGSSNWGFLNRLERGEVRNTSEQLLKTSNAPNPRNFSSGTGNLDNLSTTKSNDKSTAVSPALFPSHQKTISLDGDTFEPKSVVTSPSQYPNYCPLQLKTQDAQFRLLFPNVSRDEKVVLVFKAAWNPNEQQEFPGRVYVTAKETYFYSNHCGMTMTTSLRLDSISDVTAAGGRDWDVVFLHIGETAEPSGSTRMMIKTFLEPIRLLQRRLKFLVRNATGDGISIEEIMKALIKMEQDDPASSPSVNSWENVSVNTPVDGGTPNRQPSKDTRDLRANVLIDRGFFGDTGQHDNRKKISSRSFKLPKQAVLYVPSGMHQLVVERLFDISPKALFHVLFGDKSAVWQLLYHERGAQRICQGPWTQPQGHFRREFEYEIEYLAFLRRLRRATVTDVQVIDSANEHLLYCISDRKTPWHLPYRESFTLLSKIVITHVAKSKCKLAIHTQVEWTKPRPMLGGVIEQAALQDMSLDALDLADVLSDQVRKLVGTHGRTKKAIAIFGQIGQITQVSEFAGSDFPLKTRLRPTRKQRALSRLTLEWIASMLETVLTSTLQILIRLSRWVWNTITANGLLIVILTLSVLANLLMFSSGTSDWWKDRKARGFMSGIGVKPDITMAKAIHLSDLEDATSIDLEGVRSSGSKCRDTYDEIMSRGDNGPEYAPNSDSEIDLAQTLSARRIQSTRNQLGSRRHDLLVAVRVVNSIEREMMQAEWENWLLAETAKCGQLSWMIRHNQTERSALKGGQRPKDSDNDASRLDEMKSWYVDYCGSCSREQDLGYDCMIP